VLTMIVKAAPLLATILCRWLGRLAIPIGDADSVAEDAMLVDILSLDSLSVKGSVGVESNVTEGSYGRSGWSQLQPVPSRLGVSGQDSEEGAPENHGPRTPEHDPTRANGSNVPQISLGP